MGLISDLEERLGGTIEGAFAGMFKSPVQPAELARACSKEMTRSKKLGIGTVYVANVYSIFLSTSDHKALAGLLPTLQGELETYLLAFSRERDFQMTTRPIVRFYPDPDLKLGRFEAIGDMLSTEEIEAELGSVAGVTPEPGPKPDPAPVAAPVPAAEMQTFLAIDDHSPLSLENKSSVGIGRQDDNDLVIADVNASRHHARLEREDEGWVLIDLGATNGTLLNDEKVSRSRLHDGDVITIGVTKISYHEKAFRS